MLKKVSIAIALALCLVFGYSTAEANNDGVVVTRGGIGDGLIYDLFDIRNTELRTELWQNYFVIENTSDKWTALHLRLRSWKKSIEIWDHVILLSPRDVFWCVVQLAPVDGTTSDGVDYAAGDAIIWSQDIKTLLASGLLYPQDEVAEWAWTDILSEDLLYDCGFRDDLPGQLQAGYLEAIGLWQLQKPNYYGPYDDTHELTDVVSDLYRGSKDTGVINIYDILEAGFYAWTTPFNMTQSWPGVAAIGDVLPDNAVELGADGENRDMIDCGNVLAGSLERGDLNTGRYEMGNFLAVRNFRTEMSTTAPKHRDGSALGAIVFPVLALDSQPYNVGQGIIPTPTNAIEDAFYVNESYSSTNGPGWRDGDDLWGKDPVCDFVADFNNIWSLDDLERALQSGNLWNHFYNEHDGVDYWTDLALTFPTKHYHWCFANFPWWNDGGVPVQCAGPLAPAYLNTSFFQQYAVRVANFRSGVAATLAAYDNGPIGAFKCIWNMDEGTITPPPPIPSPRLPVFDIPIPHEVNLISVGDDTKRAGYGEGLHECDELLNTEYTDGQFTIGPFVLEGGLRALGFNLGDTHPIYGYNIPSVAERYYLPSVMEMIFTHAYTGSDVSIRSTSTPVKFDHVFELDGQLTKQPWNW
jgi:hypothetical protein